MPASTPRTSSAPSKWWKPSPRKSPAAARPTRSASARPPSTSARRCPARASTSPPCSAASTSRFALALPYVRRATLADRAEEQAMNDRVTISIEDGVADVRMVRVDKMNALDNAMFEALVGAGERLKTEKGVRAVVLSGEGRAFCAGLDMGNFGRMAEGPRGQSTVATSDEGLGARTHGDANRA